VENKKIINSVIHMQRETEEFEQNMLYKILEFSSIDKDALNELESMRKDSTGYALSRYVRNILSRYCCFFTP